MNDSTSIDELQQYIIRLEQQLAVYRGIVNQLPVGVRVYHMEDINDDTTLRLIDANPTSEHLTGVASVGTIGRTLDETSPDLRAQGIPQLYASVVRSGSPATFEVINADDETIENAFVIHAVPLPGNCLAATFEKLFQYDQAEYSAYALNAELQQQMLDQEAELRLYKLIVERANDGISFTDATGTIVSSNPAHRALYGYGDEIIGMPIGVTVAPEGARMLGAGMQQVMQRGTGAAKVSIAARTERPSRLKFRSSVSRIVRARFRGWLVLHAISASAKRTKPSGNNSNNTLLMHNKPLFANSQGPCCPLRMRW
ncbi:MAG: PAS domain-containing protein [Chloroflexaceae bacterium]|nr:PAS domain-containing protein [Chloroflexaceae bacterium]